MSKEIDGVIYLQSEDAREYYNNLGLTYDDITEGDILSLIMMLNKSLKEHKKVRADMGMTLSAKMDIKRKSNGVITQCNLYCNGSYFTRRQGISFEKGGWIGFCGWADTGNTQPFVTTFIKWCDTLK